MLLPRFSLRTSLIGITACAVFSLVVGQAFQGRDWAIVVSVAVISLLVTLLFHALLFLIATALARLVGTPQLPAHTSRGGVQLTPDEQAAPTTDESPTNN